MNLRLRAVCLAMVGTLMLEPSVAEAQQAIAITTSIGEGPGGPRELISTRSFRTYLDMLGYSEEQRSSAMTLFEGYQAAREESGKKYRREIDALQKQARDDDDHAVFLEKLPEVMERQSKEHGALATGLMDDLKLLGSGMKDLDAKWERVERARRRELFLRAGSTRENVDLVDVLYDMKMTDLEAIRDPLKEYEAELDRILVQKEQVMKEEGGGRVIPGKEFDLDKLQASMTRMKEIAAKVDEATQKHARRLQDLLPEQDRAKFEQAVRERRFPRVYKASRVAEDLTAALKFKDLTSEQQAELASLKEMYERDLPAINDAWARQIEEASKSEEGGEMMIPGGGIMVMRSGDEPEKLKDARKARRELDRRVRERLDAVLTPAQQEKLPKQEEDGPQEMIRMERR